MELLPLPTKAAPEMEVRELTPEEILGYVKPKYDATNNPLPDPSISTFLGVIKGGEVVAALCLQIKLHAEPLIVEHGYSSCIPLLVKKAEEHILEKAGPQWVYLFAPAGRVAQLAQTMGMQMEPWVVMSKLVMPESPSKSPIELMSHAEVVDNEGKEIIQ